MKKLVLAVIFLLGMNVIVSCEPDSIADQEYGEYQAADKEQAGSMGNTDGEDEDEDHN